MSKQVSWMESKISFGNSETLIMNLLKVENSFCNCELPNNLIYKFEGSLKLKGHPKTLQIEN